MMLSKNGKVVVQAKATVTTNAEKFDHDALLTRDSAKGEELTGIRLGGQREEIHISEMTAEAEPVSFMVPDGMCFITEDGFVLTETENGYATAGEK
jgi:hypothetical protein